MTTTRKQTCTTSNSSAKVSIPVKSELDSDNGSIGADETSDYNSDLDDESSSSDSDDSDGDYIAGM